MESRTSPYNTQDAYRLSYPDGEYSLERDTKENTLRASEVIHTVLEGETLQNISFKYFGDSGRWGDIATLNGIVDPFEIEKGRNLMIPM